MLIAILGRQPELSLAELESYFGSDQILAHNQICALIDQDSANINHFGGCLKLAKVDFELAGSNPTSVSSRVVDFYTKKFQSVEGKITLGISYYSPNIKPRQVQEIGLKIKARSNSVRLIPNRENSLSTATAHHNKLGTSPKKVEIIIVQIKQKTYVAHSIAAQNITAYANRDRKRPKRDARVGMLPPKLAQLLVNLSRPKPFVDGEKLRLLDPFCGTGVVLQEAHLLGFEVVGSDLETRMIDYSKQNLEWLDRDLEPELSVGDAQTHIWPSDINCVASETYLGLPFKSIQSDQAIAEESCKINQLLSNFLKNIRPQLAPNARLCIAVPAWLRRGNYYQDLELIKPINLKKLGYELVKFNSVETRDLLYHRADQIVARRILVLETK